MNAVFLFLVAGAVLVGLATGRWDALTSAMLDAARSAVDVALGLVGAMALFLGVVEVVRRAGLMDALARAVRPVFRLLFPDVPAGHPALGMMTLNIAANMLGLGNAATPFGVEAMRQLDRLNGDKGTATDAMCLFLAINTSGVSLLATGVVALRHSLGSRDPAGILVTSFLATSLSTAAAIAAALALARLPPFRRSRPRPAADPSPAPPEPPPEAAGRKRFRPARAAAALLFALALAAAAVRGGLLAANEQGTGPALRGLLSQALLPLLVTAGLLYGWSRGVDVYAALTEGAKEGFRIAVMIIPYLVAILVAVGMFRASGALDAIVAWLAPLTRPLGFPAEALPMALVRPLSGSGALGVMTEIMKTHGPDSFIGYLVSTINGSTETTFYVLAVYGGAVGLKRARHALPACLVGDLFGVIGATAACHLFFG
ncbi:MAG: spore maturation protein [Acidobacteria bacterium]|nr:MAG: spore maturation protein [Acidobacteriota bacterium]